jgi:uncharacterized protein
MAKVLCIYHGNCADGFGAAWAVRHALQGEVEFHAGFYGKEPPDVADRDVLLVDFSYKRPVLERMLEASRSLIVLDHHKTAQEDLDFLPSAGAHGWDHAGDAPKGMALFDMNRSGAGLAWDYLHPYLPRPRLIDHIEDRDLWRFKLPQTREIQAALFSYPYAFEVWDELMAMPAEQLAVEGIAIERKHHKDIAELVAVTKRTMTIGGYAVPAASLPYTLSSDAGNLMAKGERFAACYWDTPEHRVFSLRSTADGIDVSTIAASYGGGGHKNASGFQVPRDHDLART